MGFSLVQPKLKSRRFSAPFAISLIPFLWLGAELSRLFTLDGYQFSALWPVAGLFLGVALARGPWPNNAGVAGSAFPALATLPGCYPWTVTWKIRGIISVPPAKPAGRPANRRLVYIWWTTQRVWSIHP